MRIPRRRFIRLVTFGTATSVVAGKLWQRDVLAYCDPSPDLKEGVFKVRVSDYPALQQEWGSVRLGINPVRPDAEPFPDGAFYPFLINRDDAGNFYVLDCECRHAGCVVPTFDLSDSGIHCPCHGSRYWIDGSVVNGPAEFPLFSYAFEFDGSDILTFHIPCWGFEVKAAVLPGSTNAGLRLDFDTFANVTYEVSFRQTLNAPWTTASFATTPAGSANQTALTTFGGPASVYVDRTTATGFYAVGMKLGEV